MQVEFLKRFSGDLDSIHQKSVKANLFRVIELMESANSINDIPNIKKLKGHKFAYRVRIGDYRFGFFLDHSVISLARFVHRKDIYDIFP